jgi:hypothetical protein
VSYGTCGCASPLANIHVGYELDYRRVPDVEPAEPSEVEQIFIDSQSSVNALVRERVLSLSHAMGIRPIVYQPPSRHELTEAARAFALSRDDDDGSMASDEFAIDVADEKRALAQGRRSVEATSDLADVAAGARGPA